MTAQVALAGAARWARLPPLAPVAVVAAFGARADFGRTCNDVLSGYRVLSPLHQVVSGVLERLRDRKRADRASARARAADRRDPHARSRTPARLGEQAQHLARRLAHPVSERAPVQHGAAFYGSIAVVLAAIAIVLIVQTSLTTGLVSRFATVTRGRRELKLLFDLEQREGHAGAARDPARRDRP